MASSGGESGAIVVERSGTCLSIRAAANAEGQRIESMVPPEPGRAAVVVDGPGAAALDRLDHRLLAELHGHLTAMPGGPPRGVRLLVGRSAQSGMDGFPPLAARVADALGVEVVAPDGPLLVLRRGELFSAGQAAAWWEFAPGRPAASVGSRFPRPVWQCDLPADLALRPPSPRVTVTPIPGGLWVRAAGGSVAELFDPGFGVPPALERIVVVAGRPGEPEPPVTGLAAVIGALPPRLRQRYLLVPYGPEPAGEAPIAQRLADEIGADVGAMHGVPSYASDGSFDVSVLDECGRATWRPFVIESVYHPGAEPPTPWTWSSRLAELAQAGPATFWLADGWVVEMIASGLQVRPAAASAEHLVQRRPADPEHVDLVVTAQPAAGGVPVPVLGAIGRLARALPEGARERLRLLVTDRVDPAGLAGLAGALGLPIRRLTGDGISPVERLEPAADHAPARPSSVGRLHASGVPTAAGASLPPAMSRRSSTPDKMALTDHPLPALAQHHPLGAGASTDVPPVPSTATAPDPAMPAPRPAGPGPRPVPSPAAAAFPASAGAAPAAFPASAAAAPSPSPAEPPPPAPLGAPPAGRDQEPGPASRPAAPAPPGVEPHVPSGREGARGASLAAPAPPEVEPHVPSGREAARGASLAVPPSAPAGGGVVSLPPDRAGGTERWRPQASTVADRRQVRGWLGWRYDTASRFVTSLLAERPGLRAVAAGDDGLAVDLAAVHTFAAPEHADRLEAMRTGAADGVDRAFLACVVSGLRRLPTLTGVVVRGGPDDPAAADGYLGGEVVEPGLLPAVADPEAGMPGRTEVLIWSSTARRLDGLVDGESAPQVVFLPGTVFSVLDVDRAATPRQVLLAEVPDPWRRHQDADRDQRIRSRLRAAAQSRATVRADRTTEGPPDGVEAAPTPHPAGRGLVALPGLVPAGFGRIVA